MKEVKDILKELRLKKGISMEEMSREINNLYDVNCSKSMISRWESGKAEPSMTYARLMADYHNVTLDYLLGLKTDNNESENLTTLTETEKKLLSNYNRLNNIGKQEALKRVFELTQISKYTDDDYLTPIAAHNDFADDLEQQKLMQQDIDEL